MTKPSQKARVEKWLREGKTLTQAQARTYRIKSLSSVVNKLRRSHIPITSTLVCNRRGKIVVRYEMTV